MLQFIAANILMISLGGLLYMIARTIPRLEDKEEADNKNIVERFVMSDMPQRVDAVVNTFTGKVFRRLKVALMKLDNFLTDRIKKTSGESGNGKPKIDFKEITGEENE